MSSNAYLYYNVNANILVCNIKYQKNKDWILQIFNFKNLHMFYNVLIPVRLGYSEQSRKHNWHYDSNIFTYQTDNVVIVPVV